MIVVTHQDPNRRDSGRHFPRDQRHIETEMDGERVVRREWWWEPKAAHCSKRHRPHGRA